MDLLGIVESGNTLSFILLMHVKTTRNELVEKLCTLGLSVSYNCTCHQILPLLCVNVMKKMEWYALLTHVDRFLLLLMWTT